MKVYSVSPDRTSQIVVCGVEGAGKRSFMSLFFADRKKPTLKKIDLKEAAHDVLFIVILDGIHLQNIAEEAILEEIKTICKTHKKIKFSFLLVLGKTDLFFNHRQNPMLITEIYQNYFPFLKKLKCTQKAFVAFSYLATKISRDLMNRNIDQDDCDDAKGLLAKIGRHLTESNPDYVKRYLQAHKRAFSLISGENLILRYLSQWKEKKTWNSF